MDGPWPILLVTLAVIAAGVGMYIAWRREKERREALRALAHELGWRFSPARDHSHDEHYAHFEIFRRGHSRSAFNTLTGAIQLDGRSCPARLGDFTYKITSGSGKSRRTRTYRFSYLIIHLPFPHVPSVIVRSESILDRFAGFIGFDDIDFESAEFSRRFHVSGNDRKFAYDLIDPRMMEFLLRSDPTTIDLELGRLCLSDGRTRWEIPEFRRQLDWMQQFLSHWPRHVRADLEERARVP